MMVADDYQRTAALWAMLARCLQRMTQSLAYAADTWDQPCRWDTAGWCSRVASAGCHSGTQTAALQIPGCSAPAPRPLSTRAPRSPPGLVVCRGRRAGAPPARLPPAGPGPAALPGSAEAARRAHPAAPGAASPLGSPPGGREPAARGAAGGAPCWSPSVSPVRSGSGGGAVPAAPGAAGGRQLFPAQRGSIARAAPRVSVRCPRGTMEGAPHLSGSRSRSTPGEWGGSVSPAGRAPGRGGVRRWHPLRWSQGQTMRWRMPVKVLLIISGVSQGLALPFALFSEKLTNPYKSVCIQTCIMTI